MKKDFLTILDLTRDEAYALVQRAAAMKSQRYVSDLLSDKVLMMIFEKASTRTRLSFEVAVRRLGGSTIFMTNRESQLGRSEPLKDTARVIARYGEGIIVRTFGQEKLDEVVQIRGRSRSQCAVRFLSSVPGHERHAHHVRTHARIRWP